MAENNQHFDVQELAEKWAQGKLTPEEKAYLERWYSQFDDADITLTDSRHADSEELREFILGRINEKIDDQETPVRRFIPWRRIAAAASVLLLMSIGGYYLFRKQPSQQIAQNQNVIVPGSNKAILLSHGKRYSITDAKNGLIAMQGNTAIRKTADGKLAYSGGANDNVVYDTLIVPRGGQHQLTLADGSIAYLNADTKIRYQESFSGKERDVELISGEVIMHVKHNAAVAFNLRAKGQLIHDIGTEFDVTAYNDEPGVKTTLIQGVVKVTSASDKAGNILKPGQQAANQNNSAITVQDADIDEVTAWKNGKFLFNNTPLAEIMRQASRWYNVDIFYENDSLKEKRFGGVTARFANVSQLLNTLEMTGEVKFTIEGRRIIVQSK